MKKLGFSLLVAAVMLQAAFGAEGTWLTDLPKAQALAKEQKKLVLMDFTGSDWCPPCKMLHKNVLTTKEFVEFAKDNLILVELDFPQGKKLAPELQQANEALAKKYNIGGFPTIIVLNSNGKEIFRDEGYNHDTGKTYVAKLKKLKTKS